MSEVKKLVVAAKPEGIDETTGQLEKMDSQLDETTDSMEDSADSYGDFSTEWAGAMRTVTAGLAVAAGGLATQIPIVDEMTTALMSNLDQLRFSLDQDLRPALSDMGDELNDTNREMSDSEGTWSTVISMARGWSDALNELQTGLMEATTGFDPNDNPITSFFFKLSSFNFGSLASDAVGAINTIKNEGISGWGENMMEEFGIKEELLNLDQVGKDIISDIGGGIDDAIDNATDWGSNIISNVSDGIGDTAEDVKGAAGDIADDIMDALGPEDGIVGDAIDWGKSIPQKLVSGIGEKISNVATEAGNIAGDITDALGPENGIVGDAIGWGRSIVLELIDGIQEKASDLSNAVQNHIASTIDGYLPSSPADEGPLSTLDEVGPGLVDTMAQGMSNSTPQLEQASSEVAGASDPQGFGASRSERLQVFVDGRQVDRATQQYRDDSTARRGRFG